MSLLTVEQATNFLNKTGKRGSKTLSLLGQIIKSIEVYNTDIGSELIKEDIDRHEYLLTKTYEDIITKGVAEQADVIELRYLRNRIIKLANKVNDYVKLLKDVENGA